MALDTFLERVESPERSLAVLNRTEPDPIQRLLENLFDNQDVSISEGISDQYDEDTVVLIEDNEVVASSPLKALQDAILLVNSDLFKTGTKPLEQTTVPDVVDGLAGTRFTLRGYPESDTEKLLLILISRYIEKRAFEDGGGTLRASFQRLSRLDDETGTRRVYERLSETGVDVHVYGQPDWYPPSEFRAVVHGGHTEDFRSSWFVVYVPSDDTAQDAAALLAIERSEETWDGLWTYEEPFVDELNSYIRRKL